MIVDLLKTRCSMREFKQMPIPQHIVDYIIEQEDYLHQEEMSSRGCLE